MNSLKGASFPQIAISVCKLCRASVESGSKHNHLKSSELLEDPGSIPVRLKRVDSVVRWALLLRQRGKPHVSTDYFVGVEALESLKY
jgi:hypothetical protein